MLDKYSVQFQIFLTMVLPKYYSVHRCTYRVKHTVQYGSYSRYQQKILHNTKLFVIVFIEVSKYMHNILATLANRYSSVKFAMPIGHACICVEIQFFTCIKCKGYTELCSKQVEILVAI